MAEYTALAPLFTDIANAIRSKTGETGAITANSFPDKIISISKSFGGFGLGQIKQNYGPFGRKQCPLNEKTLIWESSSTPALGMLFVIGVQNFKYDMGQRVVNWGTGSIQMFLGANSSLSLQGYVFSLEDKKLYVINNGLRDFSTTDNNSQGPYWV